MHSELIRIKNLKRDDMDEVIARTFKQAEEIEKEQIMDAYRINPNNENWSNSGIDYYNETFKSE